MLVVEDFRGDLGETSGEEAGMVEGHALNVYEFDGLVVAQWGDDGRWYDVVGRGLAREEVLRVALSMKKVPLSG